MSLRTGDASSDEPYLGQALDESFTISGEVVTGDQRGRLLGFPTANLALPGEGEILLDGVYAGWLLRTGTGEHWPAAMSVGTNASFKGDRARRLECHVLDRDDLDLYGAAVDVTVTHRLRKMMTFGCVGDLVLQMRDDVATARDLLGVSAPEETLGETFSPSRR